jgi:cell division septum initiation protein DivIVA
MTSDPDQIRSSIEQTQQNLSADVDALAEKVSQPRIAERQVRRTRSTITNLKDRIMGSTADRASAMGGTVSSSASSVKDALTERASLTADMAGSAPEMARQRTRGNPLAAGLIAFGAGWLLSSLLPTTEPEQQVASRVKDLAAEKGRPVAQQLSQAGQEIGQELRESAQQRAEAVRETVVSAASTVTGEAQSRASDVAGHAQEAGTRVTEQASPGGS